MNEMAGKTVIWVSYTFAQKCAEKGMVDWKMFLYLDGSHKPFLQWKNPGWLGNIGDYTIQVYRDNYKDPY